MPYCTNCGGQVGSTDKFCAICGGAQAAASSGAYTPPGNGMGTGSYSAPPPQSSPSGSGMSPRTAAALSYTPWFGWIFSIWALASDRFRTNLDVRFHAFQGLYLFVAWLILKYVLSPAWWLAGAWGISKPFKLLELIVIGTGIFMMVKAHQGERFRLPLLGEWADRSVAEQGKV